jgi:hypothetical protein
MSLHFRKSPCVDPYKDEFEQWMALQMLTFFKIGCNLKFEKFWKFLREKKRGLVFLFRDRFSFLADFCFHSHSHITSAHARCKGSVFNISSSTVMRLCGLASNTKE